MTLWTVQPATALDEIRETGRFVCDRSRSFNLTKPDHLDAPYQWLIRQMEERIGPRPDGVEYPIWGWHTWEFEHRAPDPDSAAFLTRTEDKAFFTLELPEDQVVLTDFDAWHLIMMDLFIPDPAMTEDEEDAFLERYTSLPPAERKLLAQETWPRVFETDPIDTPDLTRGKFIQATFWELRDEWIKDVRILPKEM